MVSGVRNTQGLDEMAELLPEAHRELIDALRTLERHFADMQDVEFTVEQGRLYLLQTRNAKRPAQAAVRFVVDAVAEGLLEPGPALLTIDAAKLDALLHPTFDPAREYEVLARGVAASPGAAKGAIVFTRGRGRRARGGRRRRDPGQAVHGGRGCRGVRRRAGDPDVGGGQGLARRPRRARHGPALCLRRV